MLIGRSCQPLGPQTSQVELPILQNLRAKWINKLDTMQEVLIPEPMGNQQDKGNFVMNRIGMGFRKWCKLQRIEKPPATWSLHLINRGDSDSKNSFPVLDSTVKAAHTKPIPFFPISFGNRNSKPLWLYLGMVPNFRG